jgi:hypothetical protein
MQPHGLTTAHTTSNRAVASWSPSEVGGIVPASRPASRSVPIPGLDALKRRLTSCPRQSVRLPIRPGTYASHPET